MTSTVSCQQSTSQRSSRVIFAYSFDILKNVLVSMLFVVMQFQRVQENLFDLPHKRILTFTVLQPCLISFVSVQSKSNMLLDNVLLWKLQKALCPDVNVSVYPLAKENNCFTTVRFKPVTFSLTVCK
jgi:hypothetical protein